MSSAVAGVGAESKNAWILAAALGKDQGFRTWGQVAMKCWRAGLSACVGVGSTAQT